jgi:hypothetical protein
MSRTQKLGGYVLLLLGVSLALMSYAGFPDETGNLKKMQDDALAAKYCPVFVQGDKIKPDLEAVYYRMAEDETRILIAYHPTWSYEKNETPKGFEGVWDKLFYTGGLKLQGVIYGPGDNEVVEIVVDKKSGKIVRLRFEGADLSNGQEKKHLAREYKDDPALTDPPVYLEVITWNHMFELSGKDKTDGKKVFLLKPEYFTDQLWAHYKMTKKHQTPLGMDRAHYKWETIK